MTPHPRTPLSQKGKRSALKRILSSLAVVTLTAALLPSGLLAAQAHDNDREFSLSVQSNNSNNCNSNNGRKVQFSVSGTYTDIARVDGRLKLSSTYGSTITWDPSKNGVDIQSLLLGNGRTAGKTTIQVTHAPSRGSNAVLEPSPYVFTYTIGTEMAVPAPTVTNSDTQTTVTFAPQSNVTVTLNGETKSLANGAVFTLDRGTSDSTISYSLNATGCNFLTSTGGTVSVPAKPVVVRGLNIGSKTVVYGEAATVAFTTTGAANEHGFSFSLSNDSGLTDSTLTAGSTQRQFTIPALTRQAGTYAITGGFTGSDVSGANTLTDGNYIVQKATTSTSASVTSFPQNDAPSQLTISVAPQIVGVPTGTVELSGTALPNGPLTASLSEGTATFSSLSGLVEGSLTATYLGDRNFLESTAPVSVTAPECVPGTSWNQESQECVPDTDTPPECGDGFIHDGEGCVPTPIECDDREYTRTIDPCQPEECGDGFIHDGEGCVPAPNECGEGLIREGEGCVTAPSSDFITVANPGTAQWGASATLSAAIGPNAANTNVTFEFNGVTLTGTTGTETDDLGRSVVIVDVPAKSIPVGTYDVAVSWKPAEDMPAQTGSTTLVITAAPTSTAARIVYPAPGSAQIHFDVSTVVPNESLAGLITYQVNGPNGFTTGTLTATVGSGVQAQTLPAGSVARTAAVVAGSSATVSTPALTGLDAGQYVVTAEFTPISGNLLASGDTYSEQFTVQAIPAPDCEDGQVLVNGECVTPDGGSGSDGEGSDGTGTDGSSGSSGTDGSGTGTGTDTDGSGTSTGGSDTGSNGSTGSGSDGSGSDGDDTTTSGNSDTSNAGGSATDNASDSDDELAVTGANSPFTAVLAFSLVLVGALCVARRRSESLQ